MATQKQIEANRKNALKGGRKPGTRNPATLQREAVAKAVNQQIMEQAAILVRSALIPAKGMTFVYRIDEIKTKQGKVIGEKHVRVKDPDEIAEALDRMHEGGYDPEGKFYYITTKEPDFRAVNSLLDRPLGKARESLEITNPDGNLKTIIINKNSDKKKK